ncbi:MAG TPA: TIGR03557 family F420-dependent LLM class oxidoreductase [Actinomycetota bacterium]|jgi:G6PDH family F420-dependent oxidoreductase|nr:TIGR03557 family F420-dependent LLM class oxidoreductase [Actinomycetota bacterium]
MELGYMLSSEEHPPGDLIAAAAAAEEAGFTFAMISDHYNPWIDRQGQSPFVWAVIGGLAQVTERIRIGTGVTCPTIRIHPAIVAQAAATAACMLPGRFFLGVGSGERVNEHVVDGPWPAPDARLEMLEEAIGIIRDLWEGDLTTFRGTHFTVEQGRLYTLPDMPPPLYVAATGSRSVSVAAKAGDGLITTSPDAQLVRSFHDAGGRGPRLGKLTVCWDQDPERARRTAHEIWPNIAIPGPVGAELPLPRDFEQITSLLTSEEVCSRVVCGDDPEEHLAAIRGYADAGFDHLVVHQVGPRQEGFLHFYRDRILPEAVDLEAAA